MTVRFAHTRIGRAIAVGVAGSVFGVAGTLGVAAAQPDRNVAPARATEITAIAKFAVAEGLSGLSPVSLQPAGE